jgi:GNAT superfamily N-acetyltransferase
VTAEDEFRVVAVDDERAPLATEALEMISTSIGDVQPVNDLLSEIEERRRGMPSGGDAHLLAMVDGGGRAAAAAAGIYLEGVNAGFITYLAVRQDLRGKLLGRGLRGHLLESIRAEAQRKNGADPAWIVGEVRSGSPWLRTLVGAGQVIPFGFPYFHPWMQRRSEGRYVLYREPLADTRTALPAQEVVRLVYAIWRRAYRIRFPLQSETFCYMIERLQAAGTIGVHPDFAAE